MILNLDLLKRASLPALLLLSVIIHEFVSDGSRQDLLGSDDPPSSLAASDTVVMDLPVSPVDLDQLQQGLDQIRFHQIVGQLNTVAFLQPGLSRSEIENQIQSFPYQLPEEVYILYQWANGSSNTWWYSHDIGPHFRLLSLEEALSIYQTMLKWNEPDYQSWDPQWFPLFEFNGGEYLLIKAPDPVSDPATETPPVSLPIYSYFLEDGSLELEYESLTAMVLSAVEAYELGVFQIDQDGELDFRDSLWEQIWNHHNPAVVNHTLSHVDADQPLDYEVLVDVSRKLQQVEGGIDPLLAVLEAPIQNQSDWKARLVAAGALLELALQDPVPLSQPEAIKILITALQDQPSVSANEYGIIQGQITQILGLTKRGEAIEPLIEALDDHDPFVQLYAAAALGQIGDPRAVEPLIQKIRQSNRSFPYRGMHDHWLAALSWRSSLQSPYSLIQQMVGGGPEAAIHALGQIGDPRAISVLEQQLSDSQRAPQAIQALGQIDHPNSIVILQRLVNRQDPQSLRAIEVLHHMGVDLPALAVDRLMDVFQHSDLERQAAAADILRQIKAVQAIPSLTQAFWKVQQIYTEGKHNYRASTARYAILSALVEIQQEKALPLLQELLVSYTEDWLVISVLSDQLSDQLSDRPDRTAEWVLPLLIQLAEHEESYIRQEAVRALGLLNHPEGLPLLIQASKDEAAEVRWETVRILGKQGQTEAVDALANRLSDQNMAVRGSAILALGTIADPSAQTMLKQLSTADDQLIRQLAEYALTHKGFGSERF